MISSRTASSSGPERVSSRIGASTSDARIAAISPAAVIRHHSQRSTSGTPIPAPSRSDVCQAVRIEVSWVMTASEMTRISRLAARATHTSDRGPGSRFNTCRQKNRA